MHHLHSLGILHRDFRTANVLITSSIDEPLEVVVADFGVSHQLQLYADSESALATAAGATVYTVLTGGDALGPARWVAPEVSPPSVSPGGGSISSESTRVWLFLRTPA